MENIGEKRCFIITPIGNDNSDIRRAAEGVIDATIMPLLIEQGFQEKNITVAHRMPQPGSINKQVIQRILEDDLVIANLTNLNPNVMYELAIRHACRKPVIQICEDSTKLPFDIIEERTIFYINDMLGVVQLTNKLRQTIPEALLDENPDNPIYRVVEKSIIQQSDITNFEKYILKKMDSLEDAIISKSNSAKMHFTDQNIANELRSYYIATTNGHNISRGEITEVAKRFISSYYVRVVFDNLIEVIDLPPMFSKDYKCFILTLKDSFKEFDSEALQKVIARDLNNESLSVAEQSI